MTKEQSVKFVESLELQFARSYPEKSKELLIANISTHSAEAARKAYAQLLAEERFLPAPALVSKMVGEWSAEIREQQSAKERRVNQSSSSFLDKPPDSEHAAKAILLIRAVLAGAGRTKALEGMHHMATLYPQVGWATQANHLQEFYKKKNLVIQGG